MKRKYFLSLVIITIVMILTMGLTSCVPLPYCEEHHTGNVIIYNTCNYAIYVDINSPDISGDGFIQYRKISAHSSTKYINVPAGSIDIYEEDIYSDWGYWNEYLDECDDFEFEIYEGKGVTNEYGASGSIENKIKVQKQ